MCRLEVMNLRFYVFVFYTQSYYDMAVKADPLCSERGLVELGLRASKVLGPEGFQGHYVGTARLLASSIL